MSTWQPPPPAPSRPAPPIARGEFVARVVVGLLITAVVALIAWAVMAKINEGRAADRRVRELCEAMLEDRGLPGAGC